MKAIGSPLDFIGLNVYTLTGVYAQTSRSAATRSSCIRPRT